MDKKQLERRNDNAMAGMGAIVMKPEQCRYCMFNKGPKPYADKWDKAYCEIFPYGTSNGKPAWVMHNTGECIAYVEE